MCCCENTDTSGSCRKHTRSEDYVAQMDKPQVYTTTIMKWQDVVAELKTSSDSAENSARGNLSDRLSADSWGTLGAGEPHQRFKSLSK